VQVSLPVLMRIIVVSSRGAVKSDHFLWLALCEAVYVSFGTLMRSSISNKTFGTVFAFVVRWNALYTNY